LRNAHGAGVFKNDQPGLIDVLCNVMSDKPELEPNNATQVLFLYEALQALAATACALRDARGAVIGVPAGPLPADDLRVVAATGDSPPVGTLLTLARLAAPHRQWPLPGGEPAPGTLILFGPGEAAPEAGPAWQALLTATGLTLAGAQTGAGTGQAGVQRAARHLSAKARQSEERARALEAAIAQMTDGVAIADADGQMVRINPAGVEMLGRGLIEGPPAAYPQLYQVYTPDGRLYGGDELPLARAVQGETVIGVEVTVRRPDGSECILNISATPLRDEAGTLSGAVAVMRDVTTVKEADRLKDEFLAIVSHELRTPLSAILGYSDILLRGLHGPLNERQARAQTGVRNNAQRLLQIINDLLDVTKLEAHEVQLVIEPLRLPSAVNTVIRSVQRIAFGSRIEIVNATPTDLPPILADDERLQQILVNLLTNAVKFTPPGGRVVIDARPTPVPAAAPPDAPEAATSGAPRSVEITVQDTGIGLTGDQPERVWERFYQADSTSSRSYGGTGLGLYIVRILATLHGGTIWATSPGRHQGTTIHLRLPLAPVVASAAHRARAAHHHQATRPRALGTRRRGQP
jgi:signal transduction histidine kinase